MALPVDVQSIDVIRQFRAQLCRFGEDAKNALAAAEMEISRMVDWLTNDRRLYWQAEIRRRREDLSQAKAELFRKRTSQMFGHEASLAEQRENLRVRTQRLQEAEDKLERVRRWVAPLQQAIMEYRSQSRPLADMVDADLENALALLDRMIGALEEYSSTPPPTTDYVRTLKEERRAAASSTAEESPAKKADESREPDESPATPPDDSPEAETPEGPP